MQEMGSVPILCINVNITIDTKLKFDANADANSDFDTKCERTSRERHGNSSIYTLLYPHRGVNKGEF